MAEIYMYTAKKRIVTPGRVIEKGEKLPSPDYDHLHALGYLEKTKAKTKKPKKPTTHEE